jgi:hypothetical protein
MNDYDIKMATQAEVLLRRTEKMLETVREAQKYVSDMNPNLAFRLWSTIEVDLSVFNKMANELKEEYGTPKEKS